MFIEPALLVRRKSSLSTEINNVWCNVQLLKMPKGWSFAQGAAFLVQSLTAYYGLKSLGNIKVP